MTAPNDRALTAVISFIKGKGKTAAGFTVDCKRVSHSRIPGFSFCCQWQQNKLNDFKKLRCFKKK